MKKYKKVLAAIMLSMAMTFVVGCKPEDETNNEGENDEVTVTVTTVEPSEITKTTAICGAEAIVSEGAELAEIGVCWNTHENPTVNDKLLSTTTWNEPFSCTLTNLEPGTEYYVRAFALCNSKYYYGENKSFTTESTAGNGSLNGHDYLDLGLPSGTLWATCNVGAETPDGDGDYFSWGETTPKTYYDWSTNQYYNGYKLTKYCTLAGYGYNEFTDDLTELQPGDDAATANWGSGWGMPTKAQWEELMNNTTMTWTIQNGSGGYMFTASNGMSLFLPVAGFFFGSVLQAASGGYYWSSSLYTDRPDEAWCFLFASDNYYIGHVHRYNGCPVRPVCSSR